MNKGLIKNAISLVWCDIRCYHQLNNPNLLRENEQIKNNGMYTETNQCSTISFRH